jgi:hypothetical protein
MFPVPVPVRENEIGVWALAMFDWPDISMIAGMISNSLTLVGISICPRDVIITAAV